MIWRCVDSSRPYPDGGCAADWHWKDLVQCGQTPSPGGGFGHGEMYLLNYRLTSGNGRGVSFDNTHDLRGNGWGTWVGQ